VVFWAKRLVKPTKITNNNSFMGKVLTVVFITGVQEDGNGSVVE
jgi:hypothetical protein